MVKNAIVVNNNPSSRGLLPTNEQKGGGCFASF
jgi:hypothetical protein